MNETTRTGLVAAGIVFGSAAAVAFVVGLASLTGGPSAGGAAKEAGVAPANPVRGWFGPSAAREGEEWSHRELVTYLKGKGLKVETDSSNLDAHLGPSMYFSKSDLAYSIPLDELIVPFGPGFWKDRVHVQLLESSRKAKDEAGTTQHAGFSWGRFKFVGDRAYLTEIQAALP